MEIFGLDFEELLLFFFLPLDIFFLVKGFLFLIKTRIYYDLRAFVGGSKIFLSKKVLDRLPDLIEKQYIAEEHHILFELGGLLFVVIYFF